MGRGLAPFANRRALFREGARTGQFLLPCLTAFGLAKPLERHFPPLQPSE
jgi:hypothetical protein